MKDMAREADLFIRTQIRQQGAEETEVVELSVPALVYEKNNSCFVTYEETDRDNGAKTACRIRLSSGRMEITRKGQINSYMELAEGKDTSTDYRTPYGVLKLDIHTETLRIKKTAGDLEVKAEYSLLTGEELMSRNKMTLRAVCREEKTDDA